MATKLCSSVGWTVEECESNIFYKYSLNETMATEFDFKSVMLYPMTRSVYGWIINDNWELSQTDKIAVTIPKDYPEKKAIEFIIPEFNLQHFYSGNESALHLTADSDFLFLGADLEIEILSFIQ